MDVAVHKSSDQVVRAAVCHVIQHEDDISSKKCGVQYKKLYFWNL